MGNFEGIDIRVLINENTSITVQSLEIHAYKEGVYGSFGFIFSRNINNFRLKDLIDKEVKLVAVMSEEKALKNIVSEMVVLRSYVLKFSVEDDSLMSTFSFTSKDLD